MVKTTVHTQCPYCDCPDLRVIGTQEGVTVDLILANCTNPRCEPYTLVVAKVPKEPKKPEDG